jgi:hypothetical protein
MIPWTQIQRDRLDELKESHCMVYGYNLVWFNYWVFNQRFIRCLNRRLK